jgi:phosphoglycerate dehydrogenase-like enzyme
MAVVLFACPMDEERRAVLKSKVRGEFDVVILDRVPPEKREAAWAQADVAIVVGFAKELPADLASKAPTLRMIQTLVAGVDHLSYGTIPRSVLVCGNAGAYSVSVGEHAMALLLSSAKDVPRRTEEIRTGIFDQTAKSKALAGSTILVLGMGGIGSYIARVCKAFDMRVIGVGRSGALIPPADEGGRLSDVPRLLPRADYVVVALPMTASTVGLVDRAFLSRMKEDAVLVNIARGKIVAEDDLYEHLKAHPRFRAAIDVWWVYPDTKHGRPFHRPFHELPNIVMTPHNANAIPHQQQWAMEAAIDNVLRFLRNEPPHNVIDPSEYESLAAASDPSENSEGIADPNARI